MFNDWYYMSKTSQSSSAKDLAYIAVFTALTIVLGFIPPIPAGPLGVPILVQNLGIILMGMVLGARRGTLSVLLFIALACTGLPILAGGRSGLVAITSPTAGFFLGYLPAAAVIGLISRWRSGRNVLINILAGIVGGILVNYACGIAGMMIVGHVSFTAALVTLPAYLPGDLLKIVVAASVTAAQLKALPHIRPAKTQDDQAQSALDQIDSPEHNAAVTDSPIINTANTVNIPDSSNSSGNIDKTASTDKEYTSHD